MLQAQSHGVSSLMSAALAIPIFLGDLENTRKAVLRASIAAYEMSWWAACTRCFRTTLVEQFALLIKQF
jgi:hypothetical protein